MLKKAMLVIVFVGGSSLYTMDKETLDECHCSKTWYAASLDSQHWQDRFDRIKKGYPECSKPDHLKEAFKEAVHNRQDEAAMRLSWELFRHGHPYARKWQMVKEESKVTGLSFVSGVVIGLGIKSWLSSKRDH